MIASLSSSHYLSPSASNVRQLLRAYSDSSERNIEHIPSSLSASPKAKMIGESDRYDADMVAHREAEFDDPDCPIERSNKPREPRIGSSSIPFEGDVYDLLDFIDTMHGRCYDETWDGTHVAENVKSDGEAEIHDTNGRLRLVVATETIEDDCVALLMRPNEFRAIFGPMQAYRSYSLKYFKIGDKLGDVSYESGVLRREICDREKDLAKLQKSDSAAAGIWRCEERLKDLRARYEVVERRESKLRKKQKEVVEWMNSVRSPITETIEHV